MGMNMSAPGCRQLILLFCLLLLSSSGINAQDYAKYPLQALETSSPQSTIQDFLRHAEASAKAWEQGDAATLEVIFELTQDALDFSDTARGYSWREQTNRVILLKEVLDRIPAEDLAKAPTLADVERLGTNRWAIPRTRIELVRIDSGDRAGEFLFSADTVGNLHHYYRRSQHLPILSGSTHDIFQTFIESDASDRVGARIRNELRPVEALSPREVVDEFLFHMNKAYEVIIEVEAAMEAEPPSISLEEAIEAEKEARLHIERAVELIDLTDVAMKVRDDIGLEVALMLKEIIDRASLPPIIAIPGEQTAALAGGSGGIRWLFPHTGIEIARLNKGPEAAQYRFSAHTRKNIPEFYNKVRELPYRGATNRYKGEENSNEEDYQSGGVSPGFFRRYAETPGMLVPQISILSPLVEILPDAADQQYLGQTYWQWAGLFLSIILLSVLIWFIYKLAKIAEQHIVGYWSIWLRTFPPLAMAWLVTTTAAFLESEVNLTAWVNIYTLSTATALTYLFTSLAVYQGIVALAVTLFTRVRRIDERFENLVHICGGGVGFVVAVTVFVYGVRSLGFEVLPLMAGLGVGGLAVALAIRPTLENIIGGIIIYADRPIHVGDYCTFGELSGTVEKIGLRSTRVRARNRTRVTIPNAVFSDMQITNWAVCDTMQIQTIIGVRYETTPEQMRWLLARMRQICFAHPKIENDTLRIRLHGFGASSLDISVRVYALTTDWNEYFAIQEDLWLRFMDAIAESGTSVAFPSTTVYMGEDSGMDTEASQRAEADVAAWRESNQLPFPLTPEPLKNEIMDTLDYPPRGSPGYNYEQAEDAGDEDSTSGKPPVPGPVD